MSKFLLRRLVLMLPVLFGIVLVTFVIARSIPGEPCTAMYGEKATPAICEALTKRLGLDKTIPEQFVIYISNALRGDLGDSSQRGMPVTDLLAQRLPTTIELAGIALIFAIIFGVPLGIIAAYNRNSPIDVVTMIVANIGVSMPVFWLALMLKVLFSVTLKDSFLYLPPSGSLPAGYQSTIVPFYVAWGMATTETASPFLVFLSRFNILNGLLTLNFDLVFQASRYLILPAIAVGTIPLAIIARMTRSSLVDALNQDYIRTARAKGLKERVIVTRHGLRNAMLPVITIIGLNFGYLVSGAVLTETIFGLTGVGRTLFDAITARDYQVIQAVTLVVAFSFVFINLIVDLLYGFLDPRIRLS
ncbi:MAG TPA: ABC transporter permease [Aggregatilineales bacterium]|nr:ABC transporter permease [Aggregatilineales bacterium]